MLKKYFCQLLVYVENIYIFDKTKTNTMTISQARAEKNLQDAIDGYQAKKLQEKNEQMIEYFQSQIEQEKEAIIDCLEQNFISMAQHKIRRIIELKNAIIVFENA